MSGARCPPRPPLWWGCRTREHSAPASWASRLPNGVEVLSNLVDKASGPVRDGQAHSRSRNLERQHRVRWGYWVRLCRWGGAVCWLCAGRAGSVGAWWPVGAVVGRERAAVAETRGLVGRGSPGVVVSVWWVARSRRPAVCEGSPWPGGVGRLETGEVRGHGYSVLGHALHPGGEQRPLTVGHQEPCLVVGQGGPEHRHDPEVRGGGDFQLVQGAGPVAEVEVPGHVTALGRRRGGVGVREAERVGLQWGCEAGQARPGAARRRMGINSPCPRRPCCHSHGLTALFRRSSDGRMPLAQSSCVMRWACRAQKKCDGVIARGRAGCA